MIADRLYKLRNSIQPYHWGKSGSASIINRLTNTPDPEAIAAELWIGAHPNAPSIAIAGAQEQPLDKLIQLSPNLMLGEKVLGLFGGNLPFLFKVLSVNSALSIQAHPDKTLAKKLHALNPTQYPDENHKPEVSIALTDLELLHGFRHIEEIQRKFCELPILLNLLSIETRNRLTGNLTTSSEKSLLRSITEEILKTPTHLVLETNLKLQQLLRDSSSAEAYWFLKLARDHSSDSGLLFIFLLNYLKLSPGEALFIGPNTPHAYLYGELLECMANSDNVVRAGLTPKFKDIETLLEMLNYAPATDNRITSELVTPDSNWRRFSTPAKEFEIEQLQNNVDIETVLTSDGPSVIFCLEGSGKLASDKEQVELFLGESIFIPASVNSVKLSCSPGSFVRIHVP